MLQNDPWNRLYRTVYILRPFIYHSNTKESIKKVKDRLNRKKKVTSQTLAVQLHISRTSVRQILKNDLFIRLPEKSSRTTTNRRT